MKFLSAFSRGPVLSLALLVVALLPGIAAAERVEITDDVGVHGVQLQSQGQTGVELHYGMKEFSIDAVSINGEEMQSIALPGVIIPSVAGSPNLPGFGRGIAIPQGATPVLTIVSSQTMTLTGVNVAPAPVVQREDDDTPPVLEKDMAIYGTDAAHPASPVMITEPGLMRGMDLVTIGIQPFQYNPITRELTVYTELNVRVDFEGGNGHFGEDRLRSRYWEPLLQAHVMNYASIQPVDFNQPRDNRDGYEYIIICPDNPIYIPWAEAIADWRKLQGISTQVFTTSETGMTSSQIESFLNNAYNNWDVPPVAFLLLGDYPGTGDDEGITSPLYAGYCVSDNIYADVNYDQRPDMHHGRICASSETDLEYMIGKMFTYEQTPVTDPDFYDKPVIAGGWQTERWFILCADICWGYQAHVLGKDPIREYAIYSGYPGSVWSTASNTYSVVNKFGPNGLGYIPATPQHLTDWGGNATRIHNDIQDGTYMIVHRDHGQISGWGEPYYGIGHIGILTNEEYPFVFSINCLTGKYNYAGTCFTERFHRVQYGALGLIAASEVSYSFVNDAYMWGVFDSMWPDFDPEYGDGDNTGSAYLRTGIAQSSAKWYLYNSSLPSNPSQKAVTYNLFHHHGDAFMTLYSEVPQALTVVHADMLDIGATSFAVEANDGAVISLTVDGEIIGVADATGSPVNVPIIPQTELGDMRITVTMANYFRYDTVIEIGDYTAVDDPGTISGVRLSLSQPNPFSNTTSIRFAIPSSRDGAQVELEVFDPNGRLVQTLIDGPQSTGMHHVSWNGENAAGEPAGSGVYYYELRVGDEKLTRQMTLLR